MKTSSPQYERVYTEQFAKVVDSKKKRDRAMVAAMKDAVEEVLASPERHDGALKGNQRGRFKKYVGRSSYRIVFTVCAWCRSMDRHQDPKARCEFCDETSDNTVVFFHAFKKTGRASDYDA